MRQQSFTPDKFFDKILTNWRYSRVFKALAADKSLQRVYDLGCGSGNLVKLLCAQGYDAYGVDVKPAERIIASDLNKQLPLDSNSADVITSLANIEHLNEPLLNLKEINRVLRKNGILILTTPSTAAKPVLELLAFKLKLIDPEEILDHKLYFSKKLLQNYLKQAGFSNFSVNRFQFGMNLNAIAIKN